ncbi:uncharacterized protein FPRO_10290 [Fusarium proliferatum ET1]|uniref:Uncharacterized protein n=1 Tax=Fusarium proliferatum (strain ET1) TaxID=1227346 RepID=A0A1L7VK67_FUSPR|nr:uncharacterized protein FPRO_10290 [Fusarium proliferatum ET1]CZR40702.1 uncharacterized protein FPRO_10290 [Fusarium proliferatum ET1]
MKHWSLFCLACLLNGDMALGSKLPANCATTTVLSVITTTMCSAGSPAVPTALMTGGNGNVPEQYSQPASASSVIPGSGPHVSVSHGSAESPSAGTNENTAKKSDAPQAGAGSHAGEASGATQAVKPTTVPAVGAGASASNGSSEPNHIASGQASSVTGQHSTATGTTSETSETPEVPVVASGASSSESNVRGNAIIMAGILACFVPMMIHL